MFASSVQRHCRYDAILTVGHHQVVESWDAADDSEAEAEKAKQAAERKARAEAEAAAKKKPKALRVAEHKAERARQQAEEDDTSSEEDEAEKRERLRRTEKASDMKHAEDLFGDLSVSTTTRSAPKAVVTQDPSDPSKAIDLSSLPVFKASTKEDFARLGDLLAPLISANAKRAHYALFLQEFTRRIAADLPSDQIKKIASGLTTLSNQKMQEEKAAERGGKKSKAAKSKTSLVADRATAHKADTTSYDDGLDE